MPKQNTRLSPLDLQALPEFEDEYMQSPSVVAAHAGLHSPALKNPITGGMSSPMGHTCNFEDFSKHFHLPLKAAAEKFGVRATAFKKRCRAIGIRHWPYRKVRSLKRSLQELSRTQEQAAAEGIAGVSGGLTDKQQRQMTAYQKQLKTLLSPETYGIDPSGRLNVSAPFDDGENDMDDDDDDPDSDSPYSSPRSCFVEPDSSSNALRAVESQREFMMAMSNAPSHLRTFRRQTAYHSNQVPVQLSAAAYSAFYSGQTAANVSAASTGASSKIVFGWPDSYYFNEDLMGTMDTLSGAKTTTPNAREQDGRDEQSSAPLIVPPAGSTASNDFLAADFRFEEVRQLRDGDHDGFTEPSGHIDYNSERFFDDVFLQISPDYGCLV